METLYVVRFRLYPNQAQEILFNKNIGCCRFVWNHYLALREENFKRKTKGKKPKPIPTLSQLKKTEFPWLAEVDSTSIVQSTRELDLAYQHFFKKIHGKPRFKKKSTTGSFACFMRNEVDTVTHTLKIGKYASIKARGGWDRIPDTYKIQRITVTKEANRWFASILFKIPQQPQLQHEFKHKSCGVDLGIAIPATIAFGNNEGGKLGTRYTKDLLKKEVKRKRYQRQLTRKQKGSKNRHKARQKVAVAYWRERNVRKNWVEKTSHYLASTYETVVFEDLSLSNMTRQVRKTDDGSPRIGVKAKSGLNRELTRLGLGMLVARTTQKSAKHGGQVILVNPRHTSQICSDCGHKDKSSRKSQARFQCVSCGFIINADLNAARNILSRGQASIH